MAKFKYLDMPIPRTKVKEKAGKNFHLDVKKIITHCSDGSKHEFLPQDGVAFKAGEEIDASALCTNPNCRCLRALRVDPRFQEV